MSLPVVELGGERPLAPRVDEFTAHFWSALADGRLLATRCSACGHLSFPPKRLCPRCRNRSTVWAELAGGGVLYSLTRIHAAPKTFAHDIPYSVAVIDLDEGVRLVTRMLGSVAFDDLGKPVEMVVARFSDGPLFVARLTDHD